MADKKPSATSSTQRLIGLSSPRSPFQLVETATGGAAQAPAPKPVAADTDDPTGVKGYIAFSVAHGIYPKGAGIDPEQDISDDVKLNAATIAAEINFDAQHLATMHQLDWTPVSTDQVSKLGTVGDLVDLVKDNLADPTGNGGSK